MQTYVAVLASLIVEGVRLACEVGTLAGIKQNLAYCRKLFGSFSDVFGAFSQDFGGFSEALGRLTNV